MTGQAPPEQRGILDRFGRSIGGQVLRAARGTADFIVPPACLGCQRPLGSHDALCSACWRQISFIRKPLCDRLGIPLPFDPGGIAISAAAAARPPEYDRARAVARYDGVMGKLIHGFKYADKHDARRLFARWLSETGTDLLADADIIIPVPLNRFRLISRRFNQAAILAQEVARVRGIAYAPQTLVRVKRTPSQVGLTHDERLRNVRAAFAVAERGEAGFLQGKKAVLVDDVITTGATVEACARVLRRAGAARIDVLALALVTDPTSKST